MAKVRVHELAKKYDVPSKDVLSMLSDLGEFVKAPSSTVEPPVVKRFEDKYGADLATKAEEKAAKKAAKKAPAKKAAAAPAEVAVDAPAAEPAPAPAEPAVAEERSEPLFKPGPRPRKVVEAPPEPDAETHSRPPSRSTTLRSSLPLRQAPTVAKRLPNRLRAQGPASSPAPPGPPRRPRRATTRSPRRRAWAAGPRRPPVARLHRVPVAATSAHPARRAAATECRDPTRR